ncbi:MAG: methyltransferase domain-containing protein [Gammaproteobacteria bacterium]|nr:methyltransferase domain-containing protein [Gammaproteobacteria bacterium]MCP5458078.1 methyltransferase domain-containing protein [Gammaproteobacteria bacterium]
MNLDSIARDYTQGNLLNAILAGVEKIGKTPETVTSDDLSPVDEFHVGGRLATRLLLDQMIISTDDRVLDVGCGIGGASRFTAQAFGCQVIGVDLTAEFIEVGNALCRWVGLDSRIHLLQGNVLALDCPNDTFDKAFMIHVGMNIIDKTALATEIGRVLKPGAIFGIYDIMRTSDTKLDFPVPWATTAEGSFLASLESYKNALTQVGFEIVNERNRRDFALELYGRIKNTVPGKGRESPPLGLHLIMGAEAQIKIRNMFENIEQGCIAPIELIAQKR